MANVYIKLVTEGEKALYNELQKNERKVERLNNQLKKTRASLKGAAGDSKGLASELKNVATSIMGPLGIAAAVGLALNQIKKEFEEFREKAGLTKQRQLSVAEARSEAVKNIPSNYLPGAKKEKSVNTYMADMKKIAEKTGMKYENLLSKTGPALSSMTGNTRAEFIEAITYAAEQEQMTGGRTDMEALAKASLSLKKATGLSNVKANIGWLLKAKTRAAITTDEGMTKLIPGMIGARNRGDSAEEAMELRAYMSDVLDDSSGERTARASSVYERVLDTKKIIPVTRKKTNKDGSVSTTTDWERAKGKNTAEREAYYINAYKNATPAQQKEMSSTKFSEHEGVQNFLLSVLKDDKIMKAKRDAVKAGIAAPDVKDAEYVKQDVAIQKSGDSTVKTKQSKFDAMKNQLQLTNKRKEDANEQSDIDNYFEVRKELGMGMLQRGIGWSSYQIGNLFSNKSGGQRIREDLITGRDAIEKYNSATNPYKKEKWWNEVKQAGVKDFIGKEDLLNELIATMKENTEVNKEILAANNNNNKPAPPVQQDGVD